MPLHLSYLSLAYLLESLSLQLLPTSGVLNHYFLKYFSVPLSLLSFWDYSDSHVRSFVIVPQASVVCFLLCFLSDLQIGYSINRR